LFVDGFQPFGKTQSHTVVPFLATPLTVKAQDRWVRGVSHIAVIVPDINRKQQGQHVSEAFAYQLLMDEFQCLSTKGIIATHPVTGKPLAVFASAATGRADFRQHQKLTAPPAATPEERGLSIGGNWGCGRTTLQGSKAGGVYKILYQYHHT
jgi:hypothetical protein